MIVSQEAAMSRIIVNTPGQGLTVPEEIVQAAGLTGEPVEIAIKDGGIFLHRSTSIDEAKVRAEALERIFERSRKIPLHGLSIRELIDEGRR
jgi:hypothetical protein